MKNSVQSVLSKKLCQALIILAMHSTAIFSGEFTKNDLALELIDNICGDTWCEGEFDFEFNHFEIDSNKSEALVEFTLISEWHNGELLFKTECRLKNINSIDQVITYYRGNPELNNSFYEDLSLCITDKEELLHTAIAN